MKEESLTSLPWQGASVNRMLKSCLRMCPPIMAGREIASASSCQFFGPSDAIDRKTPLVLLEVVS